MNEEILSAIQANPQATQAVGMAVQELLQDDELDLDSARQLERMLEFVLQNPESYGDFLRSLQGDDSFDELDLPPEFDPMLLSIMLLALKVVIGQMESGGPGYARGGLHSLARMGRFGDTELAHITPMERRILQAYGGSGTVNPRTGMAEFFGRKLRRAVSRVVKAVAPVLPVVLAVAAPGLGTTIGSALGATGTAASMLGSAALGAGSAALSGGDPLKGALGGALGAGAGSALGGAVGDAFGATLSEGTKNIVGSALIGGAQGALSGDGFAAGATRGAIGGYAGNTLSGLASGAQGAVGAGLQTAGQQFGNALTMGATPEQAAVAGGLSGLAAGMNYQKPADLAINNMKPDTAINPETGEVYTPVNQSPLGQMALDQANAPAAKAAPTAPAGKAASGFSLGTAAQMLPLLSLFGSAQTPEQVQQTVQQMTPEQREYFNRPLKTWNWDTIDAAAKMEGIPLGSYIARNWDKLSAGNYDNPAAPVQMARGGALSRMAYLAAGGGTGRSDSIPARLSDGEYVMDAETVALLGDGSTSAGARKLDQMRSKIRQHKGKSMAGGKFSANAKSPLAYLKDRA